MYTYIYIYIKSRVDIPNGRSVGAPANWATVAPLRLVDGVSKHWGCLGFFNRLGDGVSKRIDVMCCITVYVCLFLSTPQLWLIVFQMGLEVRDGTEGEFFDVFCHFIVFSWGNFPEICQEY